MTGLSVWAQRSHGTKLPLDPEQSICYCFFNIPHNTQCSSLDSTPIHAEVMRLRSCGKWRLVAIVVVLRVLPSCKYACAISNPFCSNRVPVYVARPGACLVNRGLIAAAKSIGRLAHHILDVTVASFSMQAQYARIQFTPRPRPEL
jgi:hypothetical protein